LWECWKALFAFQKDCGKIEEDLSKAMWKSSWDFHIDVNPGISTKLMYAKNGYYIEYL